MKKIGLLSDTHGHVDASMLEFLKEVDEIWHAGDIGNEEVITALELHKPVVAVHGNIDNAIMRREHPERRIFTTEGVSVLMTHIGGYPKKYAPGIRQMIKEKGIKLFISGHSHILKVIYDKEIDCLHINPGAAGISGFHHVRTMVRFILDEGNIKELEIWEKARS